MAEWLGAGAPVLVLPELEPRGRSPGLRHALLDFWCRIPGALNWLRMCMGA